jgi:hypothetical protein
LTATEGTRVAGRRSGDEGGESSVKSITPASFPVDLLASITGASFFLFSAVVRSPTFGAATGAEDAGLEV